ncbi:hypothetical protein DXG03_008689 [Asterophora parasitica]|uniref:Alcohol dehydrogenase-like C-terminal domain-containing protein n=1 Tax=Asterophora parasitica TaxID=117018 RepID=A0A9P7G7Q7_9AGAR|nr:hypothetical protein DXG03_008689 [Asterophora parasitica]
MSTSCPGLYTSAPRECQVRRTTLKNDRLNQLGTSIGKTAYMAWKEHSKAVKDPSDRKSRWADTMLLDAHPASSLVIQLAKLDGLKVIASAGSDEKVKFMESIGADVAFNYKTTSTAEVLAKHGPIDVITKIKFTIHEIQNLSLVTGKSLSINGFIVSRLHHKYEEDFYATIPGKIASGEIKYSEEITSGLDKVGDVILAVQKGTNKAKAVIKVADE